MILLEDILEAYKNCRKNKRNKKSALAFEINYVKECLKLTEELNSRKYEIRTSSCFVVDEPRPREIFAADFRDRIVHHWLTMRLEPLFENIFIEDTYNCRKGKGTYYGICRLKDKIEKISNNYTRPCYVAKFDMQRFFMSIHKPTLWRKLETFIIENYHNEQDKEDVLWLAKKLVLHSPELNCKRVCDKTKWKLISNDKSLFTCGKDYGLPIGNITSLMFANFYLNEFDWIMVFIFGKGYGRYVDDFYIVSNNKYEILNRINYIKNYLSVNLLISLHPNKIYMQECKKGIKFIGSVVKPNRIYTGNRTIYNFKETIKKINNNKQLIPEIVLCRINSYLGFLIHSKSFKIRKRILLKLNIYWKTKFKVYKNSYSKLILKNKKSYKNYIIYGKNIWTKNRLHSY